MGNTMALYPPGDLVVLLPFFMLLLLVYVYLRRSMSAKARNTLLPTEWPVVGMLPSLVVNLHRLFDYTTDLLAASGNSFEARGPPMSGLRFFVTRDPDNVRHIFISNFANYPKGEEFASVFDVMGDSFFNADGESWRRQRARVQHIMSNPRLLAFMAACCRGKVEKGLLPILEHMARAGAPFDLQCLITRFAFDMTAMPVFGADTCRLSIDMPPLDVANAMDTVMQVGFFRHTVPVSCWKLMRSLGIGPERRLAAAQRLLRRFVAEMIEKRRAGAADTATDGEKEGAPPPVDIVSSYIGDPDYVDEDGNPREFMYATFINYMVAGRDTVGTALSWFFSNLIKHPRVAARIREELAPIASRKAGAKSGGGGGMVVFEPEETKPLVYLQAALFESMRLYPPGPIERKMALADDVLPSGHTVRAGDNILIPLYSMGRDAGVWGEDCAEYRPERWVTEDGKLRHVPAHRFMPFNAGPRSCLGKDISVVQMKSVIAAVAWNFDLEMARGHVVEPKVSVVMQIKNGLMVKAKKR
ncbi:alkane hydroxylase MAH1-like [Oryza brachyantha]|uniref:alkane hydroxylase MAH1-like n=1 Tax=Oryza brachyantha TaxID=4533 RepID=UPI001ADACF1A|nr:alkane hydroxylase MAH1-like [Oryza brachyantha]